MRRVRTLFATIKENLKNRLRVESCELSGLSEQYKWQSQDKSTFVGIG